MKTYQVINGPMGQVIKTATEEKTLWIPVDETNSDYQEYLKWLAENNKSTEIEAE